MKLYVVTLKEPKAYIEVRDIAKKVDSLCIITVVEKGLSYEFQSQKAAEAVAKVFDGEIEIISYDIKTIYK